MSGKLFIISAPSGAGKTTLINRVIGRLSSTINIAKVITYTTKAPRTNEKAGIDYHFISVAEFKEKIAQNFFIEYSTQYDNYYGTPAYIKEELEIGKSFFLIIDLGGAARIKELYQGAIYIWIYPQSLDVLEKRLRLRNTENEAQIKKRISLALQELSDEKINKLFDHHILNDDLELALNNLEKLIRGSLEASIFHSKKNI